MTKEKNGVKRPLLPWIFINAEVLNFGCAPYQYVISNITEKASGGGGQLPVKAKYTSASPVYR